MKRYLSILVVATVLGFMVVWQFRTANRVEREVSYDRAEELTLQLRALTKERTGLQAEAEDLEKKLAHARQGWIQAGETLRSEIREAAVLAGMTALTGPGVRVLVDDSSMRSPGAIFAVKDEDILKIVNELRAAGAEALSINGQRLISTSEIRLAGSFIDINLQKVSPPYEILAIGDQVALRGSLEIPGGVLETLREGGATVTVESKEQLFIPAYKKSLRYSYARAAKE